MKNQPSLFTLVFSFFHFYKSFSAFFLTFCSHFSESLKSDRFTSKYFGLSIILILLSQCTVLEYHNSTTGVERVLATMEAECRDPIDFRYWSALYGTVPIQFLNTDPDNFLEGKNCKFKAKSKYSIMENLTILSYLSLSFSFGLLSLLTPCVFPLIPITVSYFTKRHESEHAKPVLDAFLYSLGIILSFTIVGFLMALLFGASGINRLAANPYMNLIIALIFIVFAFNLFGMFEILIPGSLLTSLSNFQSKNNLLSIWVMSFTFTLTTFTCTMPFIGTVLVSASKGDWFYPILGMLGYSFAFSIPFFLLALFPSGIKKLPRSGNWMVSFKIILGFLELAAALKFISNADLVWGWKFLSRELFLVIWAALFIATSLYLFGVFYFEHEKKQEGKSALRIFSAIVFLSLSLNFLTATNGRSLGELDAYLPPPSYQMGQTKLEEDLKWLDNLELAKQESHKSGKKIFVDFTGYTCTNCRWMEQNIFPDPSVKELLSRFILVRLYTDGEEKVHEDNQKYEEDKFGTIALPLYAGMNSEEKILGQFLGMTRDKEEFKNFLKGLLE